MDVLGLEPARKLLQLLEPAGEAGVRIDKLPDDLLDPRLLTVLDGETLVEFGQRNYSLHNVTNEVTVEPGFSWRSWLGPNTKLIEIFLPELLEREPEILRPLVRLTSQGRLAAARISLEMPVEPPLRSSIELDEEAKALKWGSKTYSGLTGKMVEVLRVLVDDYRKGGSGLPLATIRAKSGVSFQGSFINQAFKQNRINKPKIHEVSKVIERKPASVYALKTPPR